MSGDPTRPLSGIRVVELSTMITCSLASMMLAQQGAEVIKVEPREGGDPMRYLGSGKAGISALFHNCNRGKRSLAIDLKTDQGREVVSRLFEQADVVIHNYRPGVMDKLGLGSVAARATNPGLIYVAITGFGLAGPLAGAPAYDHVVQGLAGFTAQQGRDGAMVQMRMTICDKTTAYTAAQAITAALFHRERSKGVGQHIDLSMLHACLAFLWPDGMMNQTLLDEDVVQLPPMAEYYQTLSTADGHVAFAAITPDQWRAVFRIGGRPEMDDDERLSDVPNIFANITELMTLIAALHVEQSRDEVLEAFLALDIPCAPCLTHDEVVDHPQIAANAVLEIEDHPLMGRMRVVRHPSQFSGLSGPDIGPSPALGQHSTDILGELGFEKAAVDTMADAGVI